MDLIPLQFLTFRLCGLWREPSEQQHWLVRYIWKPLVINLLVFFTITLLGAMVVYRDNVKEFTECMLMSFTWIALCLKLFNFLWRRSSMDDLLNQFRRSDFVARTCDEQRIMRHYRAMITGTHITVGSISLVGGLFFFLAPLVSTLVAENARVELPFRAYLVRDAAACFWLTYAFQVLTGFIGLFLQAAFDTTLGGFVLLTCAQIDLCRQRFALSASNGNHRQATRDCALHQRFIRRLVPRIQSFFMPIILPQLFVSLVTLCTTVFNLSQAQIGDVESFLYLVYSVSLLCQVFVYCWFGNELQLKVLKTSYAIYNLLATLDNNHG